MLDTGELFELLAVDIRRRLLVLLCETDSVNVPEGLHTRGRTQVQHTTDQNSSPPTTDEFEPMLYYNHLPKLESQGLVEWDTDGQTVSRGPAFEEIEPVIRTLVANADTFPTGLL